MKFHDWNNPPIDFMIDPHMRFGPPMYTTEGTLIRAKLALMSGLFNTEYALRNSDTASTTISAVRKARFNHDLEDMRTAIAEIDLLLEHFKSLSDPSSAHAAAASPPDVGKASTAELSTDSPDQRA